MSRGLRKDARTQTHTHQKHKQVQKVCLEKLNKPLQQYGEMWYTHTWQYRGSGLAVP